MKQPDEICSLIKKELTDELEFKDNISDEELEHRIFEKISIYGRKEYISHSDRMLIGKKILNSMRKLDILQELIDDNSITEIMINGPADIFIERNGRIYKSEKRFESEEKLRDIITQIVSECNRVVNDSSPIVDARLKNGSRVNVVLNPIAINGPIMTIRRFPDTPFSMQQLINIGIDNDLAKRYRERNQILILEYAEFVSKLQLLIGSGMTVRNAFERMEADYIDSRNEGGEMKYVYEELRLCLKRLHEGENEEECLNVFGNRCNHISYKKLVTLLIQNSKKGTTGLIQALSNETKNAFEERKQLARRLGEEAQTKLLFPMILMLVVVMIIIIIPAYVL